MNKESLLSKYKELVPIYQRAVDNTKQAVEQFLNDNDIPFLVVTNRVKDFNSFFEKVLKKKYEDPFADNEDFCGVRIILYYANDIKKVNEIISQNYIVEELEDKSNVLEPNEFGYRSNHMIIKIKDSWCVTPNYSKLNNLKIELQIRTILMHAWAEIEHKLGYKNQQQIPKELQRKLYLMSAKLEEADSQFQEIKHEADELKFNTINDSKKVGKFTGKELNLDSLQALLEYYFPENEPHLGMASDLLENITLCKLSMQDVIRVAEKIKPFISFIEVEIYGKTFQANILSYGLEAFSEKFNLVHQPSNHRLEIVKKLKQKAINEN